MDSPEALNVVSDILRQADAMDSDAAAVLTTMAYDTAYHIHDHTQANTGPLDVITEWDAERYHTESALAKRIRRYTTHNIGDTFKLSLTEFLDLPRNVIDLLIRQSTDIEKARARALQDALEQGEKDGDKRNPWRSTHR